MPSKAAGPRIFLSDRAMFGYFPPNTPSEAAEYGQPGRLSNGANQKSPGTAYPGLSQCRLKPSVSRRAVPLRCCIGPMDWRQTTTRAEDGQHLSVPSRHRLRALASFFRCHDLVQGCRNCSDPLVRPNKPQAINQMLMAFFACLFAR